MKGRQARAALKSGRCQSNPLLGPARRAGRATTARTLASAPMSPEGPPVPFDCGADTPDARRLPCYPLAVDDPAPAPPAAACSRCRRLRSSCSRRSLSSGFGAGVSNCRAYKSRISALLSFGFSAESCFVVLNEIGLAACSGATASGVRLVAAAGTSTATVAGAGFTLCK